jgi:Putative Zn-dependent protease, contains TPR repeats
MKKICLIFILLSVLSSFAHCAEEPQDPQSLFYKANSLYEKREYENASEEYAKILKLQTESGPLYFNIGNTFFKMGKIGYAILAYKKAQRLMPGDSDLKSNLAYAESLTEDSSLQTPPQNKIAWLFKFPFREYSLNTVSIILAALYLILIAMLLTGIINPIFKRRMTILFYPVLIGFLLTLGGFGIRYYNEEVLVRGIVVAKEAECKYEPIDKSNNYFTLKEGQEVLILKTRNGWSRIKRLDGKLAWIKSDAVEGID